MKHNIHPSLLPLMLPIDEMHLDPANARTGHDVKRIAASLTQYGQRKPLVVNKSEGGKIEAGNGTWQAAKSLGWTHVAGALGLPTTVIPPTLIAAKEITRSTLTNVFWGSPNGLTATFAFYPLPILLGLVKTLFGTIGVLSFSDKALTALLAILGQPASRLSMGIFCAAGLASPAFVACLFSSAINAVGVFWLAPVAVSYTVAFNTEGAAVTYLISLLGIIGPRLDMIGFQLSTTPAAVLAGVVVALKYGRAPSFVLIAALLCFAACFITFVFWMRLPSLKVRRQSPQRVFGTLSDPLHYSIAFIRLLPGLLGSLSSRISFGRGRITAFGTTVLSAAFRWVDLKPFSTVLARQLNHAANYSMSLLSSHMHL